MTCKFKPLDGFHTTLSLPLCINDSFLGLKDSDTLRELLPNDGDWTTLAIYDGRVMEVIKVYNHCGYIVFHRAFEKTTKQRFPCRSYVEFILTKAGIESLACCGFFEDCEV